MIKNNPVPYILSVFLLFTNSSSYAVELSVPVGTTGYLGEIPAPVRSTYINTHMYESNLFANQPRIVMQGSQPGWSSWFPYYDEIGRAGIPIYNVRDPKGAYIVLVPNGNWTITYTRLNGETETASATFFRSKTTAMINSYNGFSFSGYKDLAWGILPRSGDENFFANSNSASAPANVHFTGTITSYSAYAIGPVKSGSYTINPETRAVFSLALGSHATTSSSPSLFDSSSNVNVNVLKACNISPQSSTNILFPTQRARLYSTPTKLAESIASINVNCPNSEKNIYLTLSPFNELVVGSQTGMTLTNTSGQASEEGFAYVVPSLISKQDMICQPNAPDALSYVGSTLQPRQIQTDFNQTIHFNLCAYGNIKADKYTGSVNVTIVIE